MSYPWPLAKIDIINRALGRTGDNTVAVANDGSDEWNSASPAYDDALAYMIESHSWGFAMLTIVLQPSPMMARTNGEWHRRLMTKPCRT